MQQVKKEFINTIDSITDHRSFDVFRDFVRMATISLSQPFYKDEYREKEYLDIIAKYSKRDADIFPKLLGLTVMALEEKHGDFLGEMFMESAHGSNQMGQFFTPFDISRMMARMEVDGIIDTLKQKPFVKVLEPSGGSGGMIVALDEALKNSGIDTSSKMYVHTTDLDPVAADMCYIHLALLGIPATVVHGNTLSLKTYRALHTPMFFIKRWDLKLDNEQPVNNEIYDMEVKKNFEKGVLF